MITPHRTSDDARTVHSLDDWLAVATEGLCEEAQRDLAERIRADWEGRSDALTTLGDPKAANRRYRRRFLSAWEMALFVAPRDEPLPDAPPLPRSLVIGAVGYFTAFPLAIAAFIVGTTLAGVWWGLFWAIALGGSIVLVTLIWSMISGKRFLSATAHCYINAASSFILAIVFAIVISIAALRGDSLTAPLGMSLFLFYWRLRFVKTQVKVLASLACAALFVAFFAVVLYDYDIVASMLLASQVLVALIMLLWFGLATRAWLKLALFGVPGETPCGSGMPVAEG